MSVTTQPRHPDCWYGVEDPSERKKIQNRLAQRALRRRKAGLPPPACPGRTTSVRSSQSSGSEDSPPEELFSHPTTLDLTYPSATLTATTIPLDTITTTTTTRTPTFSPGAPFTASIPPTLFAALWNNGALMGLKCSTVVPAKSLPQAAHVPDSLQPTLLQLTTTHPMWIDRFPFPGFRERFIGWLSLGMFAGIGEGMDIGERVGMDGGMLDEEEFLRDLFGMESFTVEAGRAGWDPGAWRVGREFARKWGFLFS